ncbi:hypothetical protein BH760_gp02 [Gordonia phage Splinter]|uniref:Uncharacterized protein n=2 Tax=Vendettavirus vendetta TaxID=2049886 RepID=A0A160DCX4_9CAUD|nr:hypothetical protein BH795_gp02 [Gordonia phage Vendetta]YP_009275357.1 hypothetical protein BH760_gp02 [Gordonia phage Splinter]ANA85550.1 hypothetical protein PBI_VENDETTA_2 [Gordonia phage Vendetta]ANA85629.1 hypothetical protein PBI_SPLINTER_2 [Gordonia phage Splinter]
MAKRGERRPWKVSYEWTPSGIRGKDAYSSREVAEMHADRIRAAGEGREDSNVVVKVEYRPTKPKGSTP